MSRVNIKHILFPTLFFILLLSNSELRGQSNRVEKNISKSAQTLNKPVRETVESKTLDTEETIKYFGSRLAFQFKKRLHLTDDEDEKQEKLEQEKAKSSKFSLFGVSIKKH